MLFSIWPRAARARRVPWAAITFPFWAFSKPLFSPARYLSGWKNKNVQIKMFENSYGRNKTSRKLNSVSPALRLESFLRFPVVGPFPRISTGKIRRYELPEFTRSCGFSVFKHATCWWLVVETTVPSNYTLTSWRWVTQPTSGIFRDFDVLTEIPVR